jgi:hypothetical protein
MTADAQPDFLIAPGVFYYSNSQQQVETTNEFSKLSTGTVYTKVCGRGSTLFK